MTYPQPLPTFTLSDPSRWQKRVEVNQDPYGLGILRFAATWASTMERMLAETPGATIADVAKQAEREADTEGITGFMYGAAALELTQCWVHGEELRRWHNLDCQFGTEGEVANESGGVLNPAIVTFERS